MGCCRTVTILTIAGHALKYITTAAKHYILNLQLRALSFSNREYIMPIYEFKCQDCRKNFEIICSVATPAGEVVCPRCGSSKTKKTISASNFRLSSSVSIPGGMEGGSGCSGASGFS